jgi:excisionase family DNA binding protein
MTPSEIDQLAEIVASKVIDRLSSSSVPGDTWLDAQGAAEVLGCSVPTIERLTRAGEIPSSKFGRLRRYRLSLLLARSEVASNAK